jgi:HSP20 family protein
MFDEFWKQFQRPSGWLEPGWGMPGPQADVAETDDAVEVSVELPGLDEKDIDIEVTDESLIIRGEKKTERENKNKDYHLTERSYGSFYRSIPLPPGAEAEKATASYKHGVLSVTLPKTAEAKARVKKIAVNKAA